MYRNMAASLIRHETIRTTVPKAKELRRVVEPLITLAKQDDVARRRLAFDRLRDKESVGKLFVAGIIPGILMAAIFMVFLTCHAKLRPGQFPSSEEA